MLKKSSLKISCLAVLVLLLFSGSAMSQTEMNLSLDSARHYAVLHNKNLINAGLAVDEAGMRLRETITQGLPQVDATVDYNNFFGSTAELSFGPVPAEIEFNPTSNLNLSVGQMIFNGSYIVGIQTARLFKQVTEANREKTELEIRAQVTQAYYLVLVSLKSRAIVQANLENIHDVLDKTKALVDTGIAEDLDYDQLNVQANMLENAGKAADRQVEIALNMLRLQMGLDAGVDLTLTDDLDYLINRSDFMESLLSQFTINENIDYQLVQLQTNIAEKQINMERAAYLPTIMGFYNFTEKLLKPEFDIQPNHVIGFNVSIPIFSSGMRQSRVRQARINHAVAENQKELLSEQLIIQEKQLRFNLNNAIEQFESQKSNVEVAKRVFDNVRLKYEQGIVSSLDLTTANNNYLQAENSYISAIMQLLEAQVEMDKLLNSI
ncbi:MAG: TolC family protein [Bacteroidales bacterium]